jgi:hypothetical protein
MNASKERPQVFYFLLKPARQILDLAIEKLDKGFKKRFAMTGANLSVGILADLARSKSCKEMEPASSSADRPSSHHG